MPAEAVDRAIQVRDVATDLERHWVLRRRRRGLVLPFVGGSEQSESAAHALVAEVLLSHVVSGVRWHCYVDDEVVNHAAKPEGLPSHIEFAVPDELLATRSLHELPKIAAGILNHIDTDDELMLDAVRHAAEYVRKRRRR